MLFFQTWLQVTLYVLGTSLAGGVRQLQFDIAERAVHQIQPTVGQWYLRPETGRKFEVIDIDDGDGMIEIQDEEGTLDQVDSDSWFTDALEATEQPQNSVGSFDNTAEPDEADGGDPVDIDVLDTKTLRVAHDEMLNEAESDSQEEGDESDEEDESDSEDGDTQ